MERLSKNILWMVAANLSGSFFNIVLFVYLARVLGPESFGYCSYATSIIFFLINFVDLGLATYGIREVAKNTSRAAEYVSDIISFRIFVAACIFALFIPIVIALPYHVVLKIVMIESALLFFVMALGSEWAFQGIEKMHMVFISFTMTPLLQCVLSFALVKGAQDVTKVPLIISFSAIPIILVFLGKLGFRFALTRVDISRIKIYLSSSLAIWAISMFAQAYNNLDIFIMGFFRSPEEIGCFTVARRTVSGFSLVLVFIANAVLPRLASSFSGDRENFMYATKKFLSVAALAVIFIFIPVAIFSRQIISIAVGESYISAAIPLRIMITAVALVFFNLPFSTGLIAAGFERDVLKQTASSAALSIFSNFILIPKYGMIGAAVSFLLAESLALGWILWLYKRRIIRW